MFPPKGSRCPWRHQLFHIAQLWKCAAAPVAQLSCQRSKGIVVKWDPSKLRAYLCPDICRLAKKGNLAQDAWQHHCENFECGVRWGAGSFAAVLPLSYQS